MWIHCPYDLIVFAFVVVVVCRASPTNQTKEEEKMQTSVAVYMRNGKSRWATVYLASHINQNEKMQSTRAHRLACSVLNPFFLASGTSKTNCLSIRALHMRIG